MGIGGLGMWEILLIFLVALLLFGAKRLPEIGSSLGKGIREFKGSIREIENEIKAPDHRSGIHAPPASGPGARGERSGEAQKQAAGREAEERDSGEPRKLSTD
jgi:sec-independent protein translocase protein TatA